MGEGVDLVVAGAGRLFQVVEPALQGVQRGIGIGGQPDGHRLAGVAGLGDDRAQLVHLFFELLEAGLGRVVGFLLGLAGPTETERQDRADRETAHNALDHLGVIPPTHVENAAGRFCETIDPERP